jgi:hypothetical protein
MIWRALVVVAYVGIPLACCIAWGGWAWFLFFAVWGFVWFGFSIFWDWAQRARAALLHPKP